MSAFVTLFTDLLKEFFKESKVLRNVVLGLLFLGLIVYFLTCWQLPGNNTIWSRMTKGSPVTAVGFKLDSSAFYTRHFPDVKKAYLIVTDTVSYNNITKNADFEKLRVQVLSKLLAKADSGLKKSGRFPYGSLLEPYLTAKDQLKKAVLKEFFNRYFVFIQEDTDPVTQQYAASVSLGKFVTPEHINSVIGLMADSLCIGQLIQKIVIEPLNEQLQVSFSLVDIYNGICSSCNTARLNQLWQTGAGNAQQFTDSLYFIRGGYDLSVQSLLILNELQKKLLQEKKSSLMIRFEGFTDPTQVSRIPFYGPKVDYPEGTVLPLPHDEQIPFRQTLTSNPELSFARGYSCYQYIHQSLYDHGFAMTYTGKGVSPGGADDNKKRSVIINISKTQ